MDDGCLMHDCGFLQAPIVTLTMLESGYPCHHLHSHLDSTHRRQAYRDNSMQAVCMSKLTILKVSVMSKIKNTGRCRLLQLQVQDV